MTSEKIHIFAGSASIDLTTRICAYLGRPVGKSQTRRFKDGETWVKIDENVRGEHCYVVQSTSTPVNENLVELLLLLDALKRASASSITAVIPYYGYARQDRKDQGRVALSAKLVANMIVTAGATRALALDLHAGQIQGFFDIPVDHLYASPVLVDHLKAQDLSDLVVVSPDVGNVKRARAYASLLNAPLVIVDKRRQEANVSEVMNIIGDVRDRNVLLCDDLIDTAGTICNAADALKERGARNIYAAATHGVLSGSARERLTASGIRKVFVSDSIKQVESADFPALEVVSVAPLLGEAIARISSNQSVSALFQ